MRERVGSGGVRTGAEVGMIAGSLDEEGAVSLRNISSLQRLERAREKILP